MAVRGICLPGRGRRGRLDRPAREPARTSTRCRSRPGTSWTSSATGAAWAPPRPLLDEHGHDARLPVPLQLVREADLGPALRGSQRPRTSPPSSPGCGPRTPGPHLVRRRHLRAAARLDGGVRRRRPGRRRRHPVQVPEPGGPPAPRRRGRGAAPRPAARWSGWAPSRAAQKILDAMEKGTQVEQIVEAARTPAGGRHQGRLLPPVRLPGRGPRGHRGDAPAGPSLQSPTTSASRCRTRCPARGFYERVRAELGEQAELGRLRTTWRCCTAARTRPASTGASTAWCTRSSGCAGRREPLRPARTWRVPFAGCRRESGSARARDAADAAVRPARPRGDAADRAARRRGPVDRHDRERREEGRTRRDPRGRLAAPRVRGPSRDHRRRVLANRRAIRRVRRGPPAPDADATQGLRPRRARRPARLANPRAQRRDRHGRGRPGPAGLPRPRHRHRPGHAGPARREGRPPRARGSDLRAAALVPRSRRGRWRPVRRRVLEPGRTELHREISGRSSRDLPGVLLPGGVGDVGPHAADLPLGAGPRVHRASSGSRSGGSRAAARVPTSRAATSTSTTSRPVGSSAAFGPDCELLSIEGLSVITPTAESKNLARRHPRPLPRRCAGSTTGSRTRAPFRGWGDFFMLSMRYSPRAAPLGPVA